MMDSFEEGYKTIHVKKCSYKIKFTEGGERVIPRYVYYNPETKVKAYAFPVHQEKIKVLLLKKGYIVENSNSPYLGEGANLMNPTRIVALMTSEDGRLKQDINSQ